MGRKWTLTAAVSASLALGACGSGSDGGQEPPSFPSANGRSLQQVVNQAKRANLVPSPAGRVFRKGANRYSFGVFTLSKKAVQSADVALYFAPGPKAKAKGPYRARVVSLQPKAPFSAETTLPGDPKTVYVVPRVVLDRNGPWYVAALFRRNGRLEASQLPSPVVGQFPKIPDVGDRMPRIHTPTAAQVGGDLSKIDTRKPFDDMHRLDLDRVLGRRPVVLTIATPQFCESRVCGPNVDEQEQVHSETGSRAAFIHLEVYKQNDPAKGVLPQLGALGLQTEPWLFVIDARGVISARIEGAFGVPELRRAVARATAGS